ncbi:MAG: beta-propeller domain-containing protein [Thermoproteota archaeon]
MGNPMLHPPRGGGEVLSQDAEAKLFHSTTNIQVAGQAEADMVKTDGEYLYVVSGSTVYILRAYPVDHSEVLSQK